MLGNDYHSLSKLRLVELNITGTQLLYVKKAWPVHSIKINVLLALFTVLSLAPSTEPDT